MRESQATAELAAGTPQAEPIAVDERTRALVRLAHRVAASEVTVMITGESGTGKEVFARAIHQNSARHAAPFVAINCAAIPENMLEAVLFGYEKGAFTGATEARPGKFELAQEGTLLLDEISEMGLALQAKLLRVLQEREVERLGARKSVPLSVRVLATSNRNLREQVKQGEFREDLYYRLNVFPLHLPPLRERRADIVALARAFIARHSATQITLPPAAETLLREHSWPGNVRELDNVIQRALILMGDRVIRAEDLHFEDADGLTAAQPPSEPQTRQSQDAREADLGDQLRCHERELIVHALKAGSRKEAAKALGISPRTLRYKLARLRDAGIGV